MSNKLQKREEAILTYSKKVRAGEFYSINTKRIKGHPGRLSRLYKNGKADVIVVTHAPRTRGINNIKLRQNPDKEDKRAAYVVQKKESVNKKHIGKKRPNMKITNSTDKSTFRKIQSKK